MQATRNNPLSSILLALAALVRLGHAARRLFPVVARRLPALDTPVPMVARAPTRLSRVVPRGYGLPLGLLLGFMPCVRLYAALAVAAAGESLAGGVPSERDRRVRCYRATGWAEAAISC